MLRKKPGTGFIEPMLLLRTEKAAGGTRMAHELKLDGYRALAIKTGGQGPSPLAQRQRLQRAVSGHCKALASMPDETVIDGEVVALDEDGRPSFNTLQNYGPQAHRCIFSSSTCLMLKGDVMAEPLVKRRELIEKHVLPKLADPIRYSPILEGSLKDLIRSVKAQGLEGLVAKRRDSKYEPGLRPAPGRKCGSIRGRSLSSPDTRRRLRISTRWSSASTKVKN